MEGTDEAVAAQAAAAEAAAAAAALQARLVHDPHAPRKLERVAQDFEYLDQPAPETLRLPLVAAYECVQRVSTDLQRERKDMTARMLMTSLAQSHRELQSQGTDDVAFNTAVSAFHHSVSAYTMQRLAAERCLKVVTRTRKWSWLSLEAAAALTDFLVVHDSNVQNAASAAGGGKNAAYDAVHEGADDLGYGFDQLELEDEEEGTTRIPYLWELAAVGFAEDAEKDRLKAIEEEAEKAKGAAEQKESEQIERVVEKNVREAARAVEAAVLETVAE